MVTATSRDHKKTNNIKILKNPVKYGIMVIERQYPKAHVDPNGFKKSQPQQKNIKQ